MMLTKSGKGFKKGALSESTMPVAGNNVKSANRTLDILELLGEATDGLRLAQISGALQLPSSSTHGIVKTLLNRGYVRCEASQKIYKLSFKIVELGLAYLQHIDVAKQAKPVMERIRTVIDETINLAVLEDDQIVYLAKEESAKTLRLAAYVSVGMRLPAHATALGKVLLSQHADKDIEELYHGSQLVALTSRTITHVGELKRELQFVRDHQYAHDNEESTEGLQCFAAPIFDHEGNIIAALSTSIPSCRVHQVDINKLISVIQAGAKETSCTMGWRSGRS